MYRYDISTIIENDNGDILAKSLQNNIKKCPIYPKLNIMDMIHGNNINIVKTLLKYDVGKKYKDSNDKTPIILASGLGNIKMLKLILKYRNDVNAETYYYGEKGGGKTALLRTIEMNQPERYDIIKILLDHGADINYQDRDNITALCELCYYNDIRGVKLLLNYPQLNLSKREPLKLCIQRKHFELIKLLLKHGAIMKNEYYNILKKYNKEDKTKILNIISKISLEHQCTVFIKKNEQIFPKKMFKNSNKILKEYFYL